ncbi:uncharacterized protein ColSpa_08690 [Colletotrichum spaethianum]|uniref:Uncharacterized protein n=1 Tax=Colletotrichum spaethianum TaxID=700344 RepID=A0AA37UIR6_9PEZI|nr:uncharacterized protein ColSpa_08690 [Colletotrichum spaethianum]GKT48509.1 hypothetical protein ColSpa_08690 [Colletotrichum spaethianum]
MGTKEGRGKGWILSKPAYASETREYESNGGLKFASGDLKKFAGLQGVARWKNPNPFDIVFFAEAHGLKNRGDCIVLVDGQCFSKTEIVKTGGQKWAAKIEAYDRPEISVPQTDGSANISEPVKPMAAFSKNPQPTRVFPAYDEAVAGFVAADYSTTPIPTLTNTTAYVEAVAGFVVADYSTTPSPTVAGTTAYVEVVATTWASTCQ